MRKIPWNNLIEDLKSLNFSVFRCWGRKGCSSRSSGVRSAILVLDPNSLDAAILEGTCRRRGGRKQGVKAKMGRTGVSHGDPLLVLGIVASSESGVVNGVEGSRGEITLVILVGEPILAGIHRHKIRDSGRERRCSAVNSRVNGRGECVGGLFSIELEAGL